MSEEKRPATDEERKKIADALGAGRVVIGNDAFHADAGKGAVRLWIRPDGKYFGVEYSMPDFGFGSFVCGLTDLTAREDVEEGMCPTGRLDVVDSECMSREFVKKVLCRLVDEAKWDTDETDTMRGPESV